MDRSAWTDERPDDLLARSDSQFELLLAEIRALPQVMRDEFRDVRAEMRDMRVETASIRRDMFRGAIALFAALVAMYATMVAHAFS